MPDFCASFQAAVVEVLVRKSRRALKRESLHDLLVCGGVAANTDAMGFPSKAGKPMCPKVRWKRTTRL